jgi:hypothetical protein
VDSLIQAISLIIMPLIDSFPINSTTKKFFKKGVYSLIKNIIGEKGFVLLPKINLFGSGDVEPKSIMKGGRLL